MGTGMRLEGKAGVITGSSRGLGLETLRALCAEGAKIVALSRNAELGQAGVDNVRAAGGAAVFEQGDVTREEDVVRAIARCRKEYGGLDLIVNNAGILGEGRLHETTNEQWDDLVATHLTGTFWGCKHAIAAMRESGRGGAIVNLGSILSFTGDGYLAAHTAVESAVVRRAGRPGRGAGGDGSRLSRQADRPPARGGDGRRLPRLRRVLL